MTLPTSQTVVCTIISKNYLHHARTLMDSLRAVHPDWRQHVLLVDSLEGEFDPAKEKFALTQVADLALPDLRKFLFRYDILELNTAVKPWFLEDLFAKTGAKKVAYLDPDIYVYRPLREVEEHLDRGGLMVLTPHLTGELDDDLRPTEHDILKAGCYNLGFIALARHPQLATFLKWWQGKLEFDCRVSLAENLFVDQRWMDLVPGIFPDVRVLRHEGYNVAYWNLMHRKVTAAKGGFKVNDDPLVFFHFSGLDVNAPSALSKHQDRFRLRDLPVVDRLVRDYVDANRANGAATCQKWIYAFNQLNDGAKITKGMRLMYRETPAIQTLVGDDPFAHDHGYLNEPWGSYRSPLVTRLMRQIWESRHDLQAAFPDIDDRHRLDFAAWFIADDHVAATCSDRFVQPVRDDVDRCLEAGGQGASLPIEAQATMELCDASRVGQSARAFVRWVYFHLPVPVSERRLRKIYHAIRPLARWLPGGSLLAELKNDIRRWRAQNGAIRRQRRRLGLLRKIRLWLRSLIAFRPLVNVPIQGRNAAESPISLSPVAERSADEPSILRFPQQTDHDFSGAGLDIVGYVRSEHGVGQSARMSAQAADAVGLPFALYDFNCGNLSRTADDSWADRIVDRRQNRIALMHINADQTPVVRGNLGRHFFEGGYTIGYWHWELPVLPEQWLGAFDLVDEIWVPTQFVQDAVQPRSHRPVVRIPHGISLSVDPRASRADFGLPEGRFLFLSMYDVLSLTERKNPEGAVAAYRRAFPNAQRETALVLKVNNSDRDRATVDALKASVADRPDIVVLDRILSRQQVNDLENLCDAFVSLHRSEGFGLGLAESMFLGKPAVGTNWSGNRDFMSPENSCPVNCRLIRLERDIGPYARGQVWADPDVEHAAYFLKKLVNERGWAAGIARRGRQTIRDHFSPQKVGAAYRERIAAILASLGATAPRKSVAA